VGGPRLWERLWGTPPRRAPASSAPSEGHTAASSARVAFPARGGRASSRRRRMAAALRQKPRLLMRELIVGQDSGVPEPCKLGVVTLRGSVHSCTSATRPRRQFGPLRGFPPCTTTFPSNDCPPDGGPQASGGGSVVQIEQSASRSMHRNGWQRCSRLRLEAVGLVPSVEKPVESERPAQGPHRTRAERQSHS
jgi:hypothetical protein